jgi:hypothetical protein
MDRFHAEIRIGFALRENLSVRAWRRIANERANSNNTVKAAELAPQLVIVAECQAASGMCAWRTEALCLRN